MATTPLTIHPDVTNALQNSDPVVALESAVITSGLPRKPLEIDLPFEIENWQSDQPVNQQLALAMNHVVRSAGAVPAMTAVIDGKLCIGLSDQQITYLAENPKHEKASVRDLSSAISSGKTAGTTVSATLLACKLALPKSIRIMATGGIGGVHRNWQQHPDISADLYQLARSRVCVVASGAKSLLDVPATLEALETLAIPVLAYRTDYFPLFYCQSSLEIPSSGRVDDIEDAAEVCNSHWDQLGLPGGLLLANPVRPALALDPTEIEGHIAEAEASALSEGITASQRTPYLLQALNQQTLGRSLTANLALLLDNADLASQLAQVLH
ncbi:MAG: pseudouridine-5'-phosphate glycosidase [Planctomycetes bacterium]|nr:pseudouridine-5'-phosphate glycosidase [Planctomycetota bacterium]